MQSVLHRKSLPMLHHLVVEGTPGWSWLGPGASRDTPDATATTSGLVGSATVSNPQCVMV